MIDDIRAYPRLAREGWETGEGISLRSFDNVVFLGMGGSGIVGDVVKSLLGKFPVCVVKDYVVPEFVGERTLVFAVSYSGNTEETLSAFDACVEKRAQLVCLSSGGKLEARAVARNLPFIKLGGVKVPRVGFPMMLFAVLRVLSDNGYFAVDSGVFSVFSNELEKKAKFIADSIGGKTPVVIASPGFSAPGLRLTQEFNENCKIFAFHSVLSEQNHNEICGFESAAPNLHFIFLRDVGDNTRVKMRWDFLKRISKNFSVSEVVVDGRTFLARLLIAIYTGDLVSYFYALKLGVDPYEQDMITNLKEELVKK